MKGSPLLGLPPAGAAIGLALLKNLRKLDLREKVVLITGRSRGLGFALASECAARGSYLTLCARNVEELERAGQELSHSTGRVVTIQCDITDQKQVKEMIPSRWQSSAASVS
jgi:short-subunit dehydrogenase